MSSTMISFQMSQVKRAAGIPYEAECFYIALADDGETVFLFDHDDGRGWNVRKSGDTFTTRETRGRRDETSPLPQAQYEPSSARGPDGDSLQANGL